MVWDMKTGDRLCKLQDRYGGPVASIAWIEGLSEDAKYPSFCYGNAKGEVVFCSYVAVRVGTVQAWVIKCHVDFDFENTERISTNHEDSSLRESCSRRHQIRPPPWTLSNGW